MSPDVVGHEEDFVREDIHTKPAAERAAFAAGQLHIGVLVDLVAMMNRRLRCPVKFFR